MAVDSFVRIQAFEQCSKATVFVIYSKLKNWGQWLSLSSEHKKLVPTCLVFSRRWSGWVLESNLPVLTGRQSRVIPPCSDREGRLSEVK
jgi:hypothetical protein